MRDPCYNPIEPGASLVPKHHAMTPHVEPVHFMCVDAEDALEMMCEEEVLEMEGLEPQGSDWRTRAAIMW